MKNVTWVKYLFLFVLLFTSLVNHRVSAQNDSTATEKSIPKKSEGGFPVLGVEGDTLFYVYKRLGASNPSDRALHISNKISKIFKGENFKSDSLLILEGENSYDLIYGEYIVTTVSQSDASHQNMEMFDLASELKEKISQSLITATEEQKFSIILTRSLLVMLVLVVAAFLYWLFGVSYTRILNYLETNKNKWLKNLAYKEYTFLTAEQELGIIRLFFKFIRIFLSIVLFYFALSIAFSIFPFTRGWADQLFLLVWSPFRSIFLSIWLYLPNLLTILVIIFVMGYFIRFVKYIFKEIHLEKLSISGFHSDWAMPTYSIVRFLLYAFMFILIFPYLPGSDSNIFRGVSVFLGLLFSLGSSSAIANMVAGLVITYMRPFKIGDKIKIGEITGVVIEKTILVTRIKTSKNEEITIPNSAVLNSNTTNFSTLARTEGLIIHSTVTIGYDVPWKEVHQALIEAALRTEKILKEPAPFVLQTGLEDFYVSYQINAYTKESILLADIYSELHQHIQDCCFEKGIEILSPHYRAARDGNMTTIPSAYLAKDYQVPTFNVKIDKKDNE